MKKILLMMGIIGSVLFAFQKPWKGSLLDIPENIQLPKEVQVCLVEGYLNFAWGYQERGLFLDTTGELYAYDFSRSDRYGTAGEGMLEKFVVIRENSEPVGKIDEETVKKIYYLETMVDGKKKFKYTPEQMCDAGQESITIFHPVTGEWIECETKGDHNGFLEDRAAKELVKIYRKARENGKSLWEYDGSGVYGSGDITMASYPADASLKGRYLVSNEAQLKYLAKEKGVTLDAILEGMDEYSRSGSIYLVEFGTPPVQALFKKGNSFQMIYKQGENCCNVAVFSYFDGDFQKEEVPCGAGGTWERIKEEDLNYDKELVRGEVYGLSESAVQNVQLANGILQEGICMEDPAAYQKFIKSCDSSRLTANGSIKDLLEKDVTPDFDKYGLAIVFTYYSGNQKFTWERTEIKKGILEVGCKMEPEENASGEEAYALGFAWIPKKYLTKMDGEALYVR